MSMETTLAPEGLFTQSFGATFGGQVERPSTDVWIAPFLSQNTTRSDVGTFEKSFDSESITDCATTDIAASDQPTQGFPCPGGSLLPPLESSPVDGEEVKREHLNLEAENRLVCSTCQDAFDHLYQLEAHARRWKHRCFVCDHPGCPKAYYRRDLLARHRHEHRESAQHKCDACPGVEPRTFRRRDLLVQHQRDCHPDRSPVDDDGGLAVRRRRSVMPRARDRELAAKENLTKAVELVGRDEVLRMLGEHTLPMK